MPTVLRLDLGSGQHPRDGFEGVDVAELGQPWVVDLDRTPWPWPDSSVDAVVSSHLVEHVIDLVAFMDELWRILAPGGTAEIRHPYAWSDWGVADPTHRRVLTEMSWYYFDCEWRELQGIDHYPIAADFAITGVDMHLAPEWAARRSAGIIAGTWDDSKVRNGVNIVNELTVTLECRK